MKALAGLASVWKTLRKYHVPAFSPFPSTIVCDDSFTVWLNGRQVGAADAKYFTKRVHRFDVTQFLQPGNNVVAVEGVNQVDAVIKGANTAAALLVQIVDASGRPLTQTDATWKGSGDPADDWTKLAFDDSGWTKPIHVWDLNANRPFDNTIWESVLEAKAPGLSKPAWLTAEGNVRDYNWGEGAPLLNSVRGSITAAMLPIEKKDDDKTLNYPADDAKFLRYARNGPLGTTDAVPEGQFVGYPQD